MQNFNSLPSPEIDQALTEYEIAEFANSVVWPAIDHIFGQDFRSLAQRRKTVRLPFKTKTDKNYNPIMRVVLGAQSMQRPKTTNSNTGEAMRPCQVTVCIDERVPELKGGLIKVLDATAREEQEWGADEETEDEDEFKWWHDSEIDWDVWDCKTFYFGEPGTTFTVYHCVEAQDEDKVPQNARVLWDSTSMIGSMPQHDIYPMPAKKKAKKSYDQMFEEMDEQIDRREDELPYMLSWNDCLRIREALLFYGVPAEKLRM